MQSKNQVPEAKRKRCQPRGWWFGDGWTVNGATSDIKVLESPKQIDTKAPDLRPEAI